MPEKELAILLTARNLASGPLRAASRDVNTFGRSVNRSASIAGKGMATFGRNVKIAAAAVVVGFGAAVKSGLDSLAERENVISATEAAIQATGGAARVSAPDIRAWSEAIETATGAAVDDKAIQDAANTLLRFTAIGRDNFERTMVAATDLGAAMKTGPQAAAKLLGKALSDPVKGMTQLRRAGVVLSAAEEKRIKALAKANRLQDAQVVLLKALESRYKGAAAASAGPYQRALNMLGDAAEDAKMALAEGFLPVIERAATWLNKKLADPRVIDDIRSAGRSIAGLFDRAIAFGERVPWESVRAAMVAAGRGAQAAYGLFTALPSWVQTAVLTGWGLNKLTGGAVGGIVSELGKGLIRGVLGMNAGVVNINAGVVNGGGGGVPGAGGGAAGAAGRGAGGILRGLGGAVIRGGAVIGGGALLANSNAGSGGMAGALGNIGGGAIAGAGLAGPLGAIAGALGGLVKGMAEERSAQNAAMAAGIREGLNSSIAGKSMAELGVALAGVEQGIRDIRATPLATVLQGDALAQLEGMRADLQRQIAKAAPEALAIQRAGERNTATMAAETRAVKDVQQAAAARTASELMGVRAAVNAAAAAFRSINFTPRITVPVTVTNRVTPFAIDRAMDRYYGRGNGSPVRSRRDE